MAKKNARRIKAALAILQALEELIDEDRAVLRTERWARAGQATPRNFWLLGTATCIQSDRAIRGLYNGRGKLHVKRSKKGMLKTARIVYKDLFRKRETSSEIQDKLLKLIKQLDFTAFLDQVKAYDRLDYEYSREVLLKCGVPQGIKVCI